MTSITPRISKRLSIKKHSQDSDEDDKNSDFIFWSHKKKKKHLNTLSPKRDMNSSSYHEKNGSQSVKNEIICPQTVRSKPIPKQRGRPRKQAQLNPLENTSVLSDETKPAKHLSNMPEISATPQKVKSAETRLTSKTAITAEIKTNTRCETDLLKMNKGTIVHANESQQSLDTLAGEKDSSLANLHDSLLSSFHSSTSGADEVFPQVAAILSPNLCERLKHKYDGGAVNCVCEATGLHLSSLSGTSILTGSLEHLQEASVLLLQLQSEAAVETDAAEMVTEASIDEHQEESDIVDNSLNKSPMQMPSLDYSATVANRDVKAVSPSEVVASDGEAVEMDEVKSLPASVECIIKSEPVTKPSTVLLRRRRSRVMRPGHCCHNKTDCHLCIHQCDLCDFCGTKVRLAIHQQRVHPTVTEACSICGQQFGLLREMRRHRLIHFNESGCLHEKGWRQFCLHNPDAKDKLPVLWDFEPEMKGKDWMKIEQQPCSSKTDDNSVMQDIKIACGDCNFEGSFDEVRQHKESVHPAIEWECSACKVNFLPQLYSLHRQQCEKVLQSFDNNSGDEAAEEISMDTQEKTSMEELNGESDAGDVDESNSDGRNHTKSVESRLPRWAQCLQCGTRGTPHTIRRHVLNNHNDKYRCVGCEEDFVQIREVRAHMRETHNAKSIRKGFFRKKVFLLPREKPVMSKCPQCNKVLKSVKHLKNHLRTHLPQEKVICHECGFTAKDKRAFYFHFVNCHASLDQRTCKICNKEFTQKNSLQTHMKTKHAERATHACDECGKLFKSASWVKNHKKRVHRMGPKPFQCEQCGKGFCTSHEVRLHNVTHMAPDEKDEHKPFVCNICGKLYLTKSHLQQHANIHRGTRPYICKICDKSFTHMCHLSKHKKVHSEDRPHVCIHCGKGFKFPYKLKDHMVTHSKQGIHVCHQCNKVFTALSTLKKHNCKARYMDTVAAMLARANPKQSTQQSTQQRVAPGILSGSRSLLIKQEGSSTYVYSSGEGTGVELDTLEEAGELGEGQYSLIGVSEPGGNEMNLVQLQEQIVEVGAEEAVLLEEPKDEDMDSDNIKHEGELHIVELANTEEEVEVDVDESKEGMDKIMYMCGVCSKMFESQERCNEHINFEHSTIGLVVEEEQEVVE